MIACGMCKASLEFYDRCHSCGRENTAVFIDALDPEKPTLRDQFAMIAMRTFFKHRDKYPEYYEGKDGAEWCYAQADAMLAEREKKP